MLPNEAILGWINCLEQTSWNLYDPILHLRKMSLLKEPLGKVPTLGNITLGCPRWPSPALDRAARVSTHCGAFCHPLTGIMWGNHKQQQSEFSPFYFYFFQTWAGGQWDLGSALRSAAEPGCQEGGFAAAASWRDSAGANPAAEGVFGTRTLQSSLLVPLMAQLFLPQLSSKLLPTLPSLKPHWLESQFHPPSMSHLHIFA